MLERRLHHSLYELLQQDQYTPEEVAEVLWTGVDVVRHAAFTGELRAQIIEHDIISIRRDDVLAWLEATDGPAQHEPPSRDTSGTEAYVRVPRRRPLRGRLPRLFDVQPRSIEERTQSRPPRSTTNF